jgi:hypothetical protein
LEATRLAFQRFAFCQVTEEARDVTKDLFFEVIQQHESTRNITKEEWFVQTVLFFSSP